MIYGPRSPFKEAFNREPRGHHRKTLGLPELLPPLPGEVQAQQPRGLCWADGRALAAGPELSIREGPWLPLKASFQGDIDRDIGTDIDVDMDVGSDIAGFAVLVVQRGGSESVQASLNGMEAVLVQTLTISEIASLELEGPGS